MSSSERNKKRTAAANQASREKGLLFKKGVSGNPGGRPVGTLNLLRKDFVKALSDDFREHGVQAIEACRKASPDRYLSIVASVIPKEIITRPTDEYSDEILGALLGALRDELQAAGVLDADGRVRDQAPKKGARAIPPVH